MWWSNTAGGAPISGACAGNLRREAKLWWDQTGTLGYGCVVPNQSTKIFLNFRACISAPTDNTCSASGAKAGSGAPVYISGRAKRV